MSQPSKYVLEHLIDFDFNCDDEQKHNLRRVDESDEFRETLENDERRKVALLEHWRQFHRIDHLGAYSIISPFHLGYSNIKASADRISGHFWWLLSINLYLILLGPVFSS